MKKVVIIGSCPRKKLRGEDWREYDDKDFIRRKGKLAWPWSFAPTKQWYLGELRRSLPTWLYYSVGGKVGWQYRIVDFKGPSGKKGTKSPWPEYTPEYVLEYMQENERGFTGFYIENAKGEVKWHTARMWFLLDACEQIDPPLTLEDFEPIGENYKKPGQNFFAFMYKHE